MHNRAWRVSWCGAVALLACATLARAADYSTLVGKHIVGYQGWFGCPSDPVDARWFHWFRGAAPAVEALTVDLWPDLSEFEKSDLCVTGMTLPSGAPAYVFSSENSAIVDRHFRWMREYGIDGVAAQRFLNDIEHSPSLDRADLVLRRIRAAAEAESRGFFVMYDVSAVDGDHAVAVLENDWRRLAADGLTASPSYMRHRGRPVVGVWGLGFRDRNVTAEQAAEIVRFFKEEQKTTLLGGVPSHWRMLDGDSQEGREWEQVYRSFDILSPWTVGRFRTPKEADVFTRKVMRPDIAEARARGQDYLPVVFPGFSWHNLQHGEKPIDEIPRLCGSFYEEQIDNALSSGADMLYSAMFDELDEGTALMKVETSPKALPSEAQLLAPNAANCAQGADLYLVLAGRATARLGRLPKH